MIETRFVYYSPECDELFTLNIKPKVSAKVYKLYLKKRCLLEHVIYLGEL